MIGVLLLWHSSGKPAMSGNGADLACRGWLCKLDTDDKVPNNSTFSVNRFGGFHESEILVIARLYPAWSRAPSRVRVSSERERDENQC